VPDKIKLKVIDDTILDGPVDRCLVKVCPVCSSELADVGVTGLNSLSFRAMPDAENGDYGDSWYTDYDFDSAMIECGHCGHVLQMTGVYAEAKEYKAKYLSLVDRLTETAEDIEESIQFRVIDEWIEVDDE
jgi:hypothetical protein